MFVHVTRHDTMSKTALRATLKGGRRRGKNWIANVKEWTGPMQDPFHQNRCEWQADDVMISDPPPQDGLSSLYKAVQRKKR